MSSDRAHIAPNRHEPEQVRTSECQHRSDTVARQVGPEPRSTRFAG